MNKEQQELVDEGYKNWKVNGRDFWEEQVDGMFTSELGEEKVDKISKTWFIDKIKTDPEFSQRWGLTIEEREFSLEERVKIWDEKYLKDVLPENSMDNLDLDGDNIPRKLITIKYNDKKIESYE